MRQKQKSSIFQVEKLSRNTVESFLKDWNVKYPYDRLWRNKYKIPFNSKLHLEANQIDIYTDIVEDLLIEKVRLKYIDDLKNKEDYEKTGSLLKENIMSTEEEDRLLKNFKFPE